ncbi:hypothetical protein H5410_003017 [Solanum commersonii]|uniref:DUF4283 domain-containing protein n=1 Tax=Solanum commersonii TaxID=4109 RepID=A0A9J6B3T9_SOLCO|nr:hypothetical protein H5410_003017 [Solanum commersonii]
MATPTTGQSSLVTGQTVPLTFNEHFPNLTHITSLFNPNCGVKDPNTLLSEPVVHNDDTIRFKEGEYATLLKPSGMNATDSNKGLPTVPLKKPTFNNGIPWVTWTEEEVTRMNIMQNLQYVVVGKFSYGWSELDELRRIIPKQCNIKGACQIGLLRHRHVLMRFELFEDFVNMMSKPSYYITDNARLYYPMRPLIYDEKFRDDEETSQAKAWISFPDLWPTFFWERTYFFICISSG